MITTNADLISRLIDRTYEEIDEILNQLREEIRMELQFFIDKSRQDKSYRVDRIELQEFIKKL